MFYTTQKTLMIVVSAILIMIGVGAIVSALYAEGDVLTLLLGVMMISITLPITIFRLKQLSTFQKMTFEWYKSEHPKHLQGNNVSCYSCGSTRINVRALMNRTFHREHFCTQCGKTLYYSREQS